MEESPGEDASIFDRVYQRLWEPLLNNPFISVSQRPISFTHRRLVRMGALFILPPDLVSVEGRIKL